MARCGREEGKKPVTQRARERRWKAERDVAARRGDGRRKVQ